MIVVGCLEIGGAQKHIFDLIRLLDPSRFEVSIVVEEAGGYFYDCLRERGITIRSLDIEGRWDVMRRFPRFVKYVREADPDVLHLFLYYPSLFGCLVRMWPGRSTPRVILAKRSMEVSLRRDHELMYRSILMRVPDVITAVSEPVRRRCVELGASPEKVRLIENGIELGAATPTGKLRQLLGLEPGTPLVGAVGNLTPRKRHRTLLQAMAALLPDVPTAHLVVMGEGQLRGELEAESRALGIQDRVHLPGMLAPAVDYIGDLSLFVLPSSEEGMSNALLEAMVAGLPCIGSDIPSNRGVITHGRDGLIVDVENPRELAETMRALLSDPGRRNALGTQARDTIRKRFDPQAMVRTNEDLYTALARQRRGA
jgi:glycosyltransferase involved in cell wall biosynthesis